MSSDGDVEKRVFEMTSNISSPAEHNDKLHRYGREALYSF